MDQSIAVVRHVEPPRSGCHNIGRSPQSHGHVSHLREVLMDSGRVRQVHTLDAENLSGPAYGEGSQYPSQGQTFHRIHRHTKVPGVGDKQIVATRDGHATWRVEL